MVTTSVPRRARATRAAGLTALALASLTLASRASTSSDAVPAAATPPDVTPASAASPSADAFPRTAAMEPAISFWRNVFGVWKVDQVVVHDMRYLGLVYEVVQLPGPIGETYTDAQRDFVTAVRESWAQRLTDISLRVALSEPLTPADQELALRIATTAGTGALASAAEQVRTQRGMRERFLDGLERSSRWEKVFREVFRQAGLPEDLALLPHVESSFQARATSSAGAVGIWQFTRGAARVFMRVDHGIDERLDPVAAARGAANYFRRAHDQLGTWPYALTSYNHGMAGMGEARRQFGDDFDRVIREYDGRTFGFASRNFYVEFLAARDLAGEPERWFPEGITWEAPHVVDEVVLETRARASEVARRYGMTVTSLVPLNPGWTARARRGQSYLPAGASVWLPAGTLAARSAPTPAPRAVAAAVPVTPADEDRVSAAEAVAAVARATYHTVRSGESLWSISQTYGLTMAELRRLNGFSSKRRTVYVGQRLKVGSAPGPGSTAEAGGDPMAPLAP